MVKGKETLAKDWKRKAEVIFTTHPDWNAGQIHRQLMEVLGEGRAPSSVSSIQKVLPKWKENYKGYDDRRWSMGTFVPQGNIEPVLSLQRQLLENGRYLTVRRARWYSILYPILSPLMEQTYPNDISQNELRIMQIAWFYCRREQIAEMNHDSQLDTSTLDRIFLVEQDISFETILHEWVNHFRPGIVEQDDSASITEDGKESTELLPQFRKLIMQSGVEQALLFIKKNPKVQPLAERWMVLSIRKDIEGIIKGGEK